MTNVVKHFKWEPRVLSPLAPRVMATVHPSAILCERDDDARHEAMEQLVEDLKHVALELQRGPGGNAPDDREL